MLYGIYLVLDFHLNQLCIKENDEPRVVVSYKEKNYTNILELGLL